jgi:Putative peptidoglycan binding domain
MRILLHSPKDTVAGAIAFVAVSAIIGNAVFMQAGRHPSPMFGGNLGMPMAASAPASPLPRPRPIEADARPPEAKSLDVKSLDTKSADVRSSELHPVEARPLESRPPDPLANQIKTTGAPPIAPSAAPANVMRPPAPIPSTRNDPVGDLITSSHRVASVQRVLTEYGYGQLKPTGTVGSDTQAAIQKFERDRKIPATGQMSDRLVRELTAMTGRPID